MRHEREQDRRRLLLVLKAVVHGNERYLNQFCFLIDHALHIAANRFASRAASQYANPGHPAFPILPDVTVLPRSAERQ